MLTPVSEPTRREQREAAPDQHHDLVHRARLLHLLAPAQPLQHLHGALPRDLYYKALLWK